MWIVEQFLLSILNENVNDTDNKNVACPTLYFYYNNFLVYFIDFRYHLGDNTYNMYVVPVVTNRNKRREKM